MLQDHVKRHQHDLEQTGSVPSPAGQEDQRSAVLQARELRSSLPADSTRQEAARGLSGSGEQLPHLDRIQRSFGHHQLESVRSHQGGQASDACGAIGAKAYAMGENAVFRENPSLHTAAHEAAHIVQQRQGVQLSGGVGRPNDRYERHADVVADRVVQGGSAEGLLGASAGETLDTGGAVQLEDSHSTEFYNDLSYRVARIAATKFSLLTKLFKGLSKSYWEQIQDGLARMAMFSKKFPNMADTQNPILQVQLAADIDSWITCYNARARQGRQQANDMQKIDFIEEMADKFPLALTQAIPQSTTIKWHEIKTGQVESVSGERDGLFTGGFAGCLGVVLISGSQRTLAHIFSEVAEEPWRRSSFFKAFKQAASSADTCYFIWDGTIDDEKALTLTEAYEVSHCTIHTRTYQPGVWVFPDGMVEVSRPDGFLA